MHFKFPLIILIFLFLSSGAQARKPLNLNGLSEQTQKEVLKRFPQIEKEKLSLDQIDEFIRFMHTRPQFEQVQVIDDGSPSYKVQFIKVRKVAEIQFQGLSSMSDTEARNHFQVKPGDTFDQNLIIQNGESLREAYKSMGFQNAVVDISLPPDAQNEDLVTVVVHVTENSQTKIHSLNFTSRNEALNKLLGKETDSRIGKALTESNLADLTKRIRSTLNEYHYVRADISGPEIHFNSNESEADLTYRINRPETYVITFEGNKQEATSQVSDVLDLDHFYSANPNIGPELANKIKNYYQGRGYARVEVTSREAEGRSAFEKKVVLTIEEGPRVKIQKMIFNGKLSRPAEYYEKFLKKNSSPLIADGYYNKDDIDTGLKNLSQELQNQGYLLSKILSTRTQYNREKDQVTVVVNLDEGPLTEIAGINFDGNDVYDSAKLLEITGLRSSGPLKLNEIETAVTNIKNFYRDNGYIEMYLMNEKEDLVTYDETNTKAHLNFKIYEGPQVRVASIAIEGNSFTKDYVILKEIDLAVGDIVTPYKLDESIARLQRTGFFSTVEVKTLEEKTPTANRTLLVRVSERDPGILTVGAGATSERRLTLRGYLGVGYRNIRGTGRGVSLRVEGNYNIAEVRYLEQKITLGYLEPYLFDTRVRGRVNLSRSKAVTDYGLHQVTEINQVNYSVEKDFTSKILGIYNIWGMATIHQFGYDNQYPLANDNKDIATTGPSLDIDFRDDPFNPTKGTRTLINAEYSSPLMGSTRTIEYIRTTASFTHYWKVGSRQDGPVVWANNLQGGYLENLSTRSDGGVPYDIKGFILGGQSTVRGFQAGTEDVFPNKTDLGSDQYLLTSAARMFLIKSELRFPVYGKFGGAVFYDGGYVAIQGLPLPDNYRDSAGFGLRYGTPVGPVNLEIAWKLDQRPGEAPYRVELSIGTF